MKKKFLHIPLFLSLISCSATPYLDDYLDSIDVPESYIYFDHQEYGLMTNRQSPLKEAFEGCNQKVFQSNSLKLGDNELSDLAVLEKLNHDYHAFLLETVMMTASEGKEAFRSLYRETGSKGFDTELGLEAFSYTEGLEEPLRDLTRLILKRNRCLSEDGWLYKRVKY